MRSKSFLIPRELEVLGMSRDWPEGNVGLSAKMCENIMVFPFCPFCIPHRAAGAHVLVGKFMHVLDPLGGVRYLELIHPFFAIAVAFEQGKEVHRQLRLVAAPVDEFHVHLDADAVLVYDPGAQDERPRLNFSRCPDPDVVAYQRARYEVPRLCLRDVAHCLPVSAVTALFSFQNGITTEKLTHSFVLKFWSLTDRTVATTRPSSIAPFAPKNKIDDQLMSLFDTIFAVASEACDPCRSGNADVQESAYRTGRCRRGGGVIGP